MRPQLAGLTRKHGDKVAVLKVNVDRQRTLASLAGVRSIPDRRLFFAGRQLEKSIGGTNLASLERLVMKHEGELGSPAPMVAQAPQVPMEGLRTLERQLPEVNDGNELQWPLNPKVVVTTEEKPEPEPAADIESGTIEPMANDWLPPGVTRVR